MWKFVCFCSKTFQSFIFKRYKAFELRLCKRENTSDKPGIFFDKALGQEMGLQISRGKVQHMTALTDHV
jgi:hypothetical protein